jgi:hypothetical protein
MTYRFIELKPTAQCTSLSAVMQRMTLDAANLQQLGVTPIFYNKVPVTQLGYQGYKLYTLVDKEIKGPVKMRLDIDLSKNLFLRQDRIESILKLFHSELKRYEEHNTHCNDFPQGDDPIFVFEVPEDLGQKIVDYNNSLPSPKSPAPLKQQVCLPNGLTQQANVALVHYYTMIRNLASNRNGKDEQVPTGPEQDEKKTAKNLSTGLYD